MGTGIGVLLGTLVIVAPILDRVVFPESAPPVGYYPKIGDLFYSRTEGFRQRVVRTDDRHLWVELTLEPGAPGPPVHVHTTFAERFRVVRGVASLQVNGEVKTLRAGEEFLVAPGVPHRPFNASDEEAVVRGTDGPSYALPREFGVFLTQAYGFFDESPANTRPPQALLQMSRFSPRYDSWLGGPPIALQKALSWVLGPWARLAGYRSYYSAYAPHLDD